MKTSLESTQARPSLSISRTVHLVRSRSAMKSVMPLNGLRSSRGLVRASSSHFSASWPFVVRTLRPFTSQRSPRFSATVWIRDVSVPAFGSVTPKAMSNSPRAMRGRYFSLIASEPYLMIGVGGNM